MTHDYAQARRVRLQPVCPYKREANCPINSWAREGAFEEALRQRE